MSCSVVDLFCGIGGLTKGLELAGLDVIAGIDIDETCKFAYEANNKARFIFGDVNNINISEIEALYPKGDIRIMTGCAPCQPFSKYTQRYRKDGQKDEKWRLLYSFANIIKNIRPHIVSMENVPELVKEEVFDDFLNILKEENYYYSWQIVFCPDYGVPQKRRRLVLLASILGDINLIEPIYNKNNYLTVRDAISNLPSLNDGEVNNIDPVHRATKLSEINKKRICKSVQGGTWKDWDEDLQLPCHKKKTGIGYRAVYGRMVWDEPSPTITTQFYGYGNGRFGHPEQNRAITYREGAILQSFPSDYHFMPENQGESFNLRNLGIHIGNAVPVELSKAIGVSIIQHLKNMEVNIDKKNNNSRNETGSSRTD